MTRFERISMFCTWLLGMTTAAAVVLFAVGMARPLPIISEADIHTYAGKCREKGAYLTTAGYVSRERAIFVCSTWDDVTGEEVVIDVHFK